MHLTSPLLAVGLALIELSAAQNLTAAQVANLEHYWSYGRSAPVYPTPQTSGRGEWATAYAKAVALVAQMTDFEKNNITYGQVTYALIPLDEMLLTNVLGEHNWLLRRLWDRASIGLSGPMPSGRWQWPPESMSELRGTKT
ncbi:hypothetical protein LTR53_013864 [Teratosphaeriaceae sp. CCFEE 6253]|nr:hypothetical protein LTR53_013864 [Teratosphaeriaceae sp. CCFEE 6253]